MKPSMANNATWPGNDFSAFTARRVAAYTPLAIEACGSMFSSSGSALYRNHNLVERFFNIFKHFRAIATHYDKFARNLLAGPRLVVIIILLR